MGCRPSGLTHIQQVRSVKMIKRQMFGRANFDLLRKRVLLAT
jgi:transposase